MKYLFTALASLLLTGPLCAQPKDLQAQLDKIAGKNAGPAPRGRGYIPLTPERLAELQAVSKAAHGERIVMMAKNQVLPSSFDCRDRIPLPVWDQGPCGSCYLVSTDRTFTCAGLFNGLGKADDSFMLSAQYGMDSPRDFGGCNGGNGTEVADWIVKNGWIAETYIDMQGVVHNDYPPYEAQSGRDRTKAGAKVWAKGWTWGFVSNSGKLSANGKHLAAPPVDQIKAAIFNYGRLNIAIDAGGEFGNGTGTITSLGDNIDHEINMSGWDDSDDTWILENQWSKSWGNGGYRKVTRKAAQHIVDHFFVSAGPLPPPPPPPVITVALPDVAAQVNTPAVFTLGISGGTEPYASVFAYGDGAVGSALTHTYTAAGTFKVVVSVIDAKKVTGAGACTVTVTSGPIPPPPPTGATVTVTERDGRQRVFIEHVPGSTLVIINGITYQPVPPAALPLK